jgi:hypothetical protein
MTGPPSEQVLELVDRVEAYLVAGITHGDGDVMELFDAVIATKELSPAQVDANKHFSGIRSAVQRCIAHLKNWKILATGYRRPLRKLAICLAAVAALEFYRLNWASSE